MAQDRDGPAAEFKRVLALATKTIAGEPELQVSYGNEAPALQGNKAKLPQVSAELTAGAAALRAGASPTILTELRQTRGEPLTMPLAVLADLVASGVPVDSAAGAVLALAARARDADLVEFRRAVERDIALGAPPAAATAAAATAADMRVNAGARQQRPGRP